jgi:hypothetical protein
MKMDEREKQKKAFGPIHRNNESDSKEIHESDSQPLKQKEPRISTVRGMMMEMREESKNALDSMTRTKCSALIWAINRRRRTGPADENSVAIAPGRPAEMQRHQS